MKRSTLILLVDSLAFAAFLFLTTTGVLLHYLLPPGSGGWVDIWGMNRHQWGDIHYYISLTFFGILSLHMVLHWKVMVNLLKGRHRDEPRFRLALGALGLVVVILLAIAPLLTPANVQEQGQGLRHQRGLEK